MRSILLPACLCLAAAFQAASANPWSEFRGHHRSGVALTGTFPIHFGPETNVLWRTSVPGGHSSPVLTDDLLFLTGFQDDQLLTLALDRATGRERWRRGLPPGSREQGSRLSHPATATPATDGQRVIAYFAPFGLVAYDLAGTERWRRPLPTPITQHGASSSPTLAGDLVLQLCDQDSGSYLLAVDRRTGAERWRVERPAFRRGFSTPLPWPADHPEFAIVAGTLRLVAYHLADGRERWSVRGLPNEMVASPVADAERIFVAGWTFGSGVPRMPAWNILLERGDQNGDQRLTRDEAPNGPARQHFAYIDADKDGTLTRDEYESLARIFDESENQAIAVRPGGTGDVTDTHVLWRQRRGLPYVPTPLLLGNRLYFIKNGGMASCLDTTTGEFLFQEERLGALGDYYSSPVSAAGLVLAISQPGTAVVFRAADTLEVLARNSLGEQVLATPAIADDTLYVRTLSRLFAFREAP